VTHESSFPLTIRWRRLWAGPRTDVSSGKGLAKVTSWAEVSDKPRPRRKNRSWRRVNSKRGVPSREVNYQPRGARAPSRIKASKPRSPAVAVRIRPGERQTNNGKGADRSDEERSLRGEGKPLNEQETLDAVAG